MKGALLNRHFAPGRQSCGQLSFSQPCSGQCQPALRVVGRAEASQAPDGAGKRAIRQSIPLAPPDIPQRPPVACCGRVVGPEFPGEQVGDAKQAGEQFFRGRLAGLEAAVKFSQPKHGPGVVFVAEGAEELFPEGLSPAAVLGTSFHGVPLALEAEQGGLLKQCADVLGPGLLEGKRAFSCEEPWGFPGCGDVGGRVQGGCASAQDRLELEHGEIRGSRGAWCGRPDHMQDDIRVGWIAIVFVVKPIGGVCVDLDITDAGRGIGELNHGVVEIRAGFAV